MYLTYLSHIPRYQDEQYLNTHLLRWQPENIINLPEGIGFIPFRMPGSPELMAANVKALGHHRVVIWAKHGVMARSDVSVKRAVDRVEYAETAAKYEYLNLSAGEIGEGLSVDFNPTCFSHPLSADGFTLAHRDEDIRQFWVEHCIAGRKIGEYFGKELGTPAVTNIWIPNGYKDSPADRQSPRRLLLESLDLVLAEKIDPRYNLDAVEPKLFGLGSEAYVVGSMEFYSAYALTRKILLTLDSGHFHPTETISDKISSLLIYHDQLLLHISRGVRWDSDHVVTFNDDLQIIANEIVRNDALERVHIGLDYFDASINRIAAWTIGARNMLRALLVALLEPREMLKQYELDGDFSSRLALQEELKSMPFSAVWDYHCMKQDVPVGLDFMNVIKDYEKNELTSR